MGQIDIGVSVSQRALQDIDKLAAGLQKTGKITDKTAASFKAGSKTISEFLQQVKALQTGFSGVLKMLQAGGAGFSEYLTQVQKATRESAALRSEFKKLTVDGFSYKKSLDGVLSTQLELILNQKAETIALGNLSSQMSKAAALRAKTIALLDGTALASAKVVAVKEAELAIAEATTVSIAREVLAMKSLVIAEAQLTDSQRLAALVTAGLAVEYDAVAVATAAQAKAALAAGAASAKNAAQNKVESLGLRELFDARVKMNVATAASIRAREMENAVAAKSVASKTQLFNIEAELAYLQGAEAKAVAATTITLERKLAVERYLFETEAQVTAGTIGLTRAVIEQTRVEAANQAVALGLAVAYDAQTVAYQAATGAVNANLGAQYSAAKAASTNAVANSQSAAATTQAGRAAAGASGAFTTYGSAVRGAAGAMSMLWFAYGQLLPLMAAFAGVRAAKEAMSLGVAFEYATTSIQSLSKDVEGALMPLDEIQQRLMAMEGLRHTPTELAAGMREFAKAGVAPAEALRDLATMSKFATIADMELGEAIKDVIGLTLAFQPTMKAATGKLFTFADAANMVAAAAMLSITEVDEMSNAFSHAAELGIVSKMRFEEVAASLAIMANAGIRGTKAATSLRTGMLKLQTAGDPVHKMFEKLGRKFNAFNEDGSVKNVVETFKELNKALAGVADEKRIAIFTKLFTARSMKAGAVLSQQVKELDAFILKLRQAAEGVGFIEEKYQDLAHTARAELDYLKVALEKMLLKPVNVEGLSEAISSIRMVVTDISPIFAVFASVIGAIGHDFINLIELAISFVKQLWDLVDGGISFAEVVDLLKTRFTDLVGFISNLNIVNLFREQFYSIDVLFINLGATAKTAAVTIQGVFESLGSMLMVIFGSAINWVIDKIFYIPDAINRMITMIGQATKDIPLLSSFYSPAMSAIGDNLTQAASAVKEAFKIDLSAENAQLKESGDLYASRIAAIKASTDALLAEKAAHYEASIAVDRLASSYGVLADQQQRLPSLGNPAAGGNLASKTLGYYFGAGSSGMSQGSAESPDWLKDSEQKLLDNLLPMRKAREEYEKGVEAILALQKKLEGTAQAISKADVGTMMSNLAAKTIGAGKAFKGSAESIRDFNTRVREAFGDTSQSYLSEYQKLQEKISDTSSKLKSAAEKEFGIGTPETAERMKVINSEMVKAYENADNLEKVALDDFSKKMEEAFGDASTGKLSAFDKMMEKIDDTVIKMESEIKKKFEGDDNGLARMRKELGLLKTEAQETAEELRKSDLKNNLEEIEAAFGNHAQRNMSEFDKELAKINKTYTDQKDAIAKKYPLEQATNATIEDRAAAMAKLDEQYQLAIQNSDILIKKSNNLWDGFALGVKDAIASTKTLGEVGYEVAGELKNAFHDTFVAAIKGDFESIGDLWDSLLDRMLDLFINWIADLIARWAMAQIGNVIMGAFGSGGGSGFGAVLGSLGAALAGNRGGSNGGVGAVGTLGTVAGTGYQMYTGESLSAAIAKGLYNYAFPRSTIAPYTPGSGQPLGSTGSPSGASPGAASAWQTSQNTYGVLSSQAGSLAPQATTALGWTYGATPTVASHIAQSGSYGVLASQAGPAAPAATPAASTFSSYAGIIGAVVSMAIMAYSSQKKKMMPDEADMFNKAGFRPETFASLIGNEFQKTVIPYFGETNAKWDQASNSLIMLADADKAKSAREDNYFKKDPYVTPGALGMQWDETAPTWKKSNSAIREALQLLFDDAQSLERMALNIGKPETFEEFAVALEKLNVAIDPSTAEGLWEGAEASTPSFDKMKKSLTDLNLSSGEMHRALILLEDAAGSASGSSEELEKYLRSLGKTQEEVSQVMADYTGSAISRMRAAGEEYLAATNPVLYSLSMISQQMQEVYTDTSMLTSAVGVFGDEANTASNAIYTLNSVMGSLDYSLQDLDSSATQAGNAIGDAAYDIQAALRVITEGSISTGTTGVGTAEGSATGGLLRGGSGVRDDLYIGTIAGRPQIAMGGEYVINQRSTQKHLSLLEAINADKYLIGGPTPPASPPGSTPKPGSLLSGVRSSKTPEDLQSLVDMLDDVTRSMRLMSGTDLAKEILEIQYRFYDMIEEAKKLGASEQDLAKIRRLQAMEIEEANKKVAQARFEFMRGINDEINNFGMTDLEIALRGTRREMQEQIAAAKALGLGESELMKIRQLQQLKAAELIEAHRKEQAEFMLNITDQIKMMGMTESEKSLFQLNREMEDMILQAKELGLGESELAKIRELYGLKSLEVMNQGLLEAVTAIGSFKDSMGGIESAALKSSTAQQKLFDILTQAKAGDFKGVETIGEVLKDISIDKSKYATAADYARDYWKTMGAVNQIEKLTNNKIAGINTEVPTISSRDAEANRKSQDEVNTRLDDLRASVVAGNVQNLKNTQKTARMLDRWESIGMPATRVA